MNGNIDEFLDAQLEQSLRPDHGSDAVEAGEDDQEYLADLVRVAELIRDLPRPSLSPGAARRIESRLMTRATEWSGYQGGGGMHVNSRHAPNAALPGNVSYLRRVLGLAASVLLVLAVIGGGSVMAAADSLPYSPLYGLKIAGEQAQLLAARSSVARARARLLIAEHRLAEIESTIASGVESNDTQIEALQQEIDNALGEIEAIPNRGALPLLSQLNGIITRQKTVLQAVLAIVPPAGRASLERTVEEADRGQSLASEALVRVLREHPDAATPAPTITPAPKKSRPSGITSSALPPAATAEPEAPAMVELSGSIQAIEGAIWLLNGQRLLVDGRTKIEGESKVGRSVNVKLVRLADGTLLAVEVEVESDTSPTPVEAREDESPQKREGFTAFEPAETQEFDSSRDPSAMATRGGESSKTPSPTETREAERTGTPEPEEARESKSSGTPSPTASSTRTREVDGGRENSTEEPREGERESESAPVPIPTVTAAPSAAPSKTSSPAPTVEKTSTTVPPVEEGSTLRPTEVKPTYPSATPVPVTRDSKETESRTERESKD
ncbi:MAG: DUF5667 domain-containing protein [Chloroflexi bacterium]|nr:DUF5667 domain-containing protein [Chloroflexota bacterium]